MSAPQPQRGTVPILLYDGGCATCRRIAGWVERSAARGPGAPGIVPCPVGNDPAALRQLNPGLDIWDAYAVSHVIMPDGSMKRGGEAVAEVLRCLPRTRRLASLLDLSLFGVRPFQVTLNLAYAVLDDVRPLFGCESCGRPKPWVRPFERLTGWVKAWAGTAPRVQAAPHFRHLGGRDTLPR
ncbi:MAG: thiol-disulfide oxidoreductase DCC family protein [Janthinobacterium lividum]